MVDVNQIEKSSTYFIPISEVDSDIRLSIWNDEIVNRIQFGQIRDVEI